MDIVNLTGAWLAAPLSATAAAAGSAASGPPATPAPAASRDTQISDLATVSTSVNLLSQAASSSATGSSDEPPLELPSLPPMPAPKPAPAVPTDDHGQSNIVFSDPDADGALIH